MAGLFRAVVLGQLTRENSSIIGEADFGASGSAMYLWAGKDSSHAAYIFPIEQRIVLSLKVFDDMAGSFVVTEQADKYLANLSGHGHLNLLHMDTATKVMRETSLADELFHISIRLRS